MCKYLVASTGVGPGGAGLSFDGGVLIRGSISSLLVSSEFLFLHDSVLTGSFYLGMYPFLVIFQTF